MKPPFTDKENSQLFSLGERAAKARRLEAEQKLAKEQLPVLFKAAISAREQCDRFPPSILLALGPDVLAAGEALSRAEFLKAAVEGSQSRIDSHLAKLNGELKRDVQEFTHLLRAKLTTPLAPKPRLVTQHGYTTYAPDTDLARLEAISGGTVVENSEALIKFCVELGAEIAEEKS